MTLLASFNRATGFLAMLICAIAIQGCSSSGGGSEEQPEQLRIIHAATDFSELRVDVSAASSSSSGSSSSAGRVDPEKESPSTHVLEFGDVVGYFEVPEGSAEVHVRETTSVLSQLDLTPTIDAGSTQTLLLVEQSDALAGVFIDDKADDLLAEEFHIRIINAIGREIDAYIAFPDDGIRDASSLAAALTFTSASSYVAVERGQYRVFVTRAGETRELVDSGAITFSPGRNYSFVVFEDSDGGLPYDGRMLIGP